MNPLLISSGEPAGIGPDLCLALAETDLPVVILGDLSLLETRARELNLCIKFLEYSPHQGFEKKTGYLTVWPVPCAVPVISGELNPQNAAYVIDLLTLGASLCSTGEFSALVTAPVHKANINAAGISFTGHTEFFADFFGVETVVMMLACSQMKVALVTTHLPLHRVSDAISSSLIIKVIQQLHHSLKYDFGVENPKINVAGLNPHAGESGYLGREEIEIITPALNSLKHQGIDVSGPLPADTMFIPNHTNSCDAYVAMYHDQGLPVLKYAGFNEAVNITLGLPIIRTSVDHGTALELAGKNKANPGSMLAAIKMARDMVLTRIK
ncbi:4-hydroxythreonine-4-phosphate dehydrogenase PdxA [Legionella pneumophila]|uniref:4-hydroxythreonine-4-phosphate dehydrogenase n=1 Tax=Legionella pneumophila subsp. pascullei TaxID=91890 RepID=A0AAX2ITC7_LEGPN|nr:4-hydroxythreonine-4-phosphate dehydrogenase PdxA [Legionella pneumophila]AMP88470.1 4-hydroxythreonine-4-phosphate dehydrogenase PdxA [Legionella pneumophila subsp. pascullei]AMP91379.1 4-hydroxythreonine-4-phosphate dehydrogenase [Legionella pneumophila subsp. pascullei]AMP94367.1 4-hydroxythreonine-4-phosphate dehydrogenase [Legionella pneumophila subsp. pascullei]SQG89161.1 4-hydroxythreonine-4-phosphate dehydrogenase [Legionella pneumophila subsp. pascullei]VEH04211.1 4-hydroxythreonin